MKHIVLLGASNSLMPFRLRDGLASNKNVKFIEKETKKLKKSKFDCYRYKYSRNL